MLRSGKTIIEAKCNFCHDSQRIVRSHNEPARWQQLLSTMKSYAQGSTLAKPINDDEEKVLEAMFAADVAVEEIECEDGTVTIFAPPAGFYKAKTALL